LKKPVKTIRRVGLVANSEKPSAQSVVSRAARLIARAGRKVHSDAETSRLGGFTSIVHENSRLLGEAVDLVLVFGGDGTMLRVAREVAGLHTPLLGINIGSLGFLTTVSSDEMSKALRCIWQGRYNLESRALLEAHGVFNGTKISCRALNDFVVSRGLDSRLISLDVSVDDELLTNYRCDGLILSSPTGSTAYSLSAGGVIVHPQAHVFQLTPICPHTLSNRSVIIGLDSRIKVKALSGRPETILSADGQHISEIPAGDSVTFRRSPHSVVLMRLTGTSFFNSLRRKLHWSGANV